MIPTLGIVMNGVTGRMGYRQHLLRSILAIRGEGGLLLSDGSRVQVDPILVGRNETKLAAMAAAHGIERYTTDLDAALANPGDTIYFDAQVTSARERAILAALAAGKHVYTEKPTADDLAGALRLQEAGRRAGTKVGVVHDKLYLPGLLALRRLIDEGFFGRLVSVRGEFGYWVFDGATRPAQRPSWNYRAEDGGGIVTDMFCHWSYVIENLFGRIEAVTAVARTHIPHRWDEQGERYDATADDAAYAIFELSGGAIVTMNSSWVVRVHRDELFELQVDGIEGSAVAGLHRCVTQRHDETPVPTWDPDVPDPRAYREQWRDAADSVSGNGFRAQWEEYLRWVLGDGEHRYDFTAAVRGIALAEAALLSSREGRRVRVEELLPSRERDPA